MRNDRLDEGLTRLLRVHALAAPVERLCKDNEIEPSGRPPVLERRLFDRDTVVCSDPRHSRIRLHGKDFCTGLRQLHRRNARSCSDVECTQLSALNQSTDQVIRYRGYRGRYRS